MITYGPKFNRSYSQYLNFVDGPLTMTAFFHKNNTHLAFTIDRDVMNRVKAGDIHSTIYKDLNDSSFATTFLVIKDFQSQTLDIKNQFSNIKPEFQDKIQYVTNEAIKLAKFPHPTQPNKHLESILFLYTFRFADYGDDFLYFLAERQHIDQAVGKKLVRTMALQVCTNQCYENLGEMNKFYHDEHGWSTEYTNSQAAVQNLFPDKEDINIRSM